MAHSLWLDKKSNSLEPMQSKARMAMDVYWTWEKEWVREFQIHSQRFSFWHWRDILDIMYLTRGVPRFNVSIDSRGVYVLHAPTWRSWSMRMDRTWVFDHQDSSPYTIQDIDTSEWSDANDTGSDVEVNLLRDL
jgi:hypothetical protein